VVTSSDSTGSYFVSLLENLNLDRRVPDFQRSQSLSGVIQANVVSNPEQVELGLPKQLKTVISFDDGSTFHSIAPPSMASCQHTVECALHLHSQAERTRLMSSSGAPGLMMRVGSIGDWLSPYEECNTYLTRDGGLTWAEARRGPHLYEFGDHGALSVMVNDKDPTDHVRYSWDEGATWTQFTFTSRLVHITGLETAPGSVSRRFLLYGTLVAGTMDPDMDPDMEMGDENPYVVFSLDFSASVARQCTLQDLEAWQPTPVAGSNECILGRRWTYYRRTQGTQCYFSTPDVYPLPTSTICPCTPLDYECGFGFIRSSLTGNCTNDGPAPGQPLNCPPGTTYNVSTGFRLIPDDVCMGGTSYPPLVIPCVTLPGEDPTQDPSNIKSVTTVFQNSIVTYEYLKGSQNVVALDSAGLVFVSEDEGATWNQAPFTQLIRGIKSDPNDHRVMVFLSNGTSHWITTDHAFTFRPFTTHSDRSSMKDSIMFNAKDNQKLIYIGTRRTASGYFRVAELSSDGGRTWIEMLTYLDKCYFANAGNFSDPDTAIYCTEYPIKTGNQLFQRRDLSLVRSVDAFETKQTLIEHLTDFVFYEKFLVCVVVSPHPLSSVNIS